MVLSGATDIDQVFKNKICWWIYKYNNIKLKIWEDPWLDFMLGWMIFDSYLSQISQSGNDTQKLEYFYHSDSDFKSRILENWISLSGYAARLKECSPVHDLRPGSGAPLYLNNTNDLREVFTFIYQIRCNLFHGAKDLKNDHDYQLVARAGQFMRVSINCWIK